MSGVVVVGSCNMDLVCFTAQMPKPGETITGISSMTCNGGKGANQAVTAGKIGSKTTLLARVGDDIFGKQYIENLQDARVDTEYVLVTPGVSTGTATILVDQRQGENCIVIVPGANGVLSVSDVDTHLPKLLETAKVLVTQMEVDRKVTLRALELAKKAGVVTIFNTAPAYNDIEKVFFENTDILCLNETEAEILTGLKYSENKEDISKLFKELIKLGCRAVVLTVGKKGSLFCFSSKPDVIANCPAPNSEVPAVDTTGAGDAFIGTMAHFCAENLNKGKSFEDALDFDVITKASKVASYSVMLKGAQTSYPTREQLGDKFFD